MKKILKFPLQLGENIVASSAAFNPVAFQVQHDLLMLWAECDADSASHRHIVTVIGTGHPLPDRSRYVGTLQQDGFVWHAYVEVKL